MNVITLYEPWATWILWGWKFIETCGHDRFRGLRGATIGIHAGLKFDEFWPDVAFKYLAGKQLAEMAVRIGMRDGGMLHGRMVCTARVAECRPLTAADSPLALCDCSGGDRYGLVLADVQPIEGHPKVKGQRGIWRWNAA